MRIDCAFLLKKYDNRMIFSTICLTQCHIGTDLFSNGTGFFGIFNWKSGCFFKLFRHPSWAKVGVGLSWKSGWYHKLSLAHLRPNFNFRPNISIISTSGSYDLQQSENEWLWSQFDNQKQSIIQNARKSMYSKWPVKSIWGSFFSTFNTFAQIFKHENIDSRNEIGPLISNFRWKTIFLSVLDITKHNKRANKTYDFANKQRAT